MSREVMQAALDVMETPHPGVRTSLSESMIYRQKVKATIEALRTALAQPEKECSRVECGGNNGCIDICWKKKPQRKEWVGLTDEERHKCWSGIDHKTCISHTRAYGDAIEAMLKEKNT